MSAIDPRSRLRRRRWFLPALRAVLWTLSVAFAFAFAIALLLVAVPFDEGGWLLGCAPVALLLVIAVGLTDANTDDLARRARYPWPYLLWIIGILASCAGGGLLLGCAWLAVRGSVQGVDQRPAASLAWLGALLLLVGIGLLVGSALLRVRSGKSAERARSVRLTGPRVPAVVTEVTRNRSDNVQMLWNVTLRFEDSQGRPRWHTLVHHDRVRVGSRRGIRFDPRKPQRRSTIFVEWDRR